MTSAGRRLAFGRPFVISGIALVIPPVPVVVPTPAPVRLNHSSIVKVALRRSAEPPSVAYWLEPFNCSAVPPTAAVPIGKPIRNTTAMTAAAK